MEPGGTYVVEVPHKLPASRYPVDVGSAESVAEWLRFSWLRGVRFELTVVSVDAGVRLATVQGVRTVTAPEACVALTLEQVPRPRSARGQLRDPRRDPDGGRRSGRPARRRDPYGAGALAPVG